MAVFKYKVLSLHFGSVTFFLPKKVFTSFIYPSAAKLLINL